MSSYPSFAAFFSAVHDVRPYVWQDRLASFVDQHGRLPDRVAVPTGLGKTATIDAVIWALGKQIHERRTRTLGQRIFHVVERRVVVDGAYTHVDTLATALAESDDPSVMTVARALRELTGEAGRKPLRVAAIHGGIGDGREWVESTGATVVVATATQFSLRLLGRAPGVSDRVRPIHAGLVGIDREVLFDEPHLASVMVSLIRSVANVQAQADEELGVPLGGMALLGATIPPHLERGEDAVVAFDPSVESESASVRYRAPRPLEAVPVAADTPGKADKLLVEAVVEQAEVSWSEHRSTAVIVNTVAAAEAIADHLSRRSSRVGESRVRLITSRVRGPERPDIKIKVGPGHVLVATQAVEAGADFTVDTLITEVAPWPSVVQRLGRLNRDGQANDPRAMIVVTAGVEGFVPLIRSGTAAVYGESTVVPVARALLDHPVGLDAALAHQDEIVGILAPDGDVSALWPEPVRAATMEHDYACRLLMTSPRPVDDVDPAVWLHGPDTEKELATVDICWRASVKGLDLMPPLPAETLTVSVSLARIVVAGGRMPGAMSDADDDDGAGDPTISGGPKGTERLGERLSKVRIRRANRWEEVTSLWDIAPGTTVVLQSDLGGYVPTLGVTSSTKAVSDLSAAAALRSQVPLWFAVSSPALAPVVGVAAADELAQGCTEIVNDDHRSARERRAEVGCEVMRALQASGHQIDEVEVRIEPYGAVVRRARKRSGGTHGDRITLASHSGLTRQIVRGIVDRAGVEPDLGSELEKAAFLHDHGKAYEPFQRMLGRREGETLLAKSDGGTSVVPALAGVPASFDHAAAGALTAERVGHSSLVCHLIASHHGGARPFVRRDSTSVHWVPRYFELSRRLGPWGLAWAEAAVRLADWDASAAPREPERSEVDDRVIDLLRSAPATRPDRVTVGVHDEGARPLRGLSGASSLAWFAAVGVLAAARQVDPASDLRWESDLTPILRSTASDDEIVEAVNALPECLDEVSEVLAGLAPEGDDKGLYRKCQNTVGLGRGIGAVDGVIAGLGAFPWTGQWSQLLASTLIRSHLPRKSLRNSRAGEAAGAAGAAYGLIQLLTMSHSNGNNPNRVKNPLAEFRAESLCDPSIGWYGAKAFTGGDGSLDRRKDSDGDAPTNVRGGILRAAYLGAAVLGTGLGEWSAGYAATGRSRRLVQPLPSGFCSVDQIAALALAGEAVGDGRVLVAKKHTANKMIAVLTPKVYELGSDSSDGTH